jgi:DNA (cytosine-5)-methyltransferase 1
VEKFIDLAIGLQPNVILMENVPGLASSVEFRSALDRLAIAGFNVTWAILDAADFGVAQHRNRLVLVASRTRAIGLGSPCRKLKTVRKAISGLGVAGVSGDFLHDYLSIHSPVVQKRIRSIPKDGGSRSELPEELKLACHLRKDGFNDVYGRMKWDAPAPTITGGCTNPSKGRFLHPEENRAITLREALLLQGFPRRFQVPRATTKQAAAQMIGNAFPPAFAAAHARAIAKSLRGQ